MTARQGTLDLPRSPQVISASRRTDVPAYHMDWLMARLREGRCEVRQPFSGALWEVALEPPAVLALVLWTRDPRPLVPHLRELDERGYRFYVLVTLNDLPSWLEPGAVAVGQVVDAMQEIADRLGPASVVWRYDPIVLTTMTPPETHLARVDALAQQLQGVTDECVTSFVDLYRKSERNLRPALERVGAGLLPPDSERDRDLLRGMQQLVAARGMTLSSCCQPSGLEAGLAQARCVDPVRLERVVGTGVTLPKRPSRAGCGCHASVDIGAYDTCPRGCVYCYATRSPAAGLAGAARCSVSAGRLGG